MFKDLWEQHKGKIAVGGLALLLGLPIVQSTLGVGFTQTDDGRVCIGVLEPTADEAE